MRVGELELGEFAEKVTEGLGRVGVGHVIEHATGRETDAHAIGAPDGDARISDLEGQAGAGGEGIAVAVGAGVGAAAQELVEEVTVGVMDLDAVEAGFLGEAGALDVFGDDAGDLFDVQGTGDDVVGHLLAGPDLALRLDGGRGDGEFAIRLVVRVRDAADVPELQEDAAALGVHGGGDLLPAGDLFVGVDTRGVRVAMAAGRDRGRLSDDQAGAGALGVIFGHQVRRDVGPFGTATRQRSHQDAVRQREGTDFERRKEGGHLRKIEGERTRGQEERGRGRWVRIAVSGWRIGETEGQLLGDG